MAEIIWWVVFKPFIGLFHATLIMMHHSQLPTIRKLKLLIGIALCGAFLFAGMLATALMIRSPWQLSLGAFIATVSACYIAGFLAAWVEDVELPRYKNLDRKAEKMT